MSISELKAKAHTGDIVAVEKLLSTLTDDDMPEAFNLSAELIDEPAMAFRILFWVSSQPRPEKKHLLEAWIRAMNNGTAAACKEGTAAERLEMVNRAIAVAPENLSIYHNAACVYCALGLAEEALDSVVSAAEHGYENMALMAEDTDLDLIRQHPGFLALVEDSQAKQQAVLDETMTRLSQEVLRGASVPTDLMRTWRCMLADNEHVAAPLGLGTLYEARPSAEEITEVLGGAWSTLVKETDLIAIREDHAFIGYHRGEHGERLPSDGPVMLFDERGYFEVAATLSELLVLQAQRHGEGMMYLKIFFHNTQQFDVELDPAVIRGRIAKLHRELLDRLAAQHEHRSEHEDSNDYGEIVRPGEPTHTAYLGRITPRPWRRGQVMRLGGPPIGVDVETRPRHEGRLMAHLATIDLDLAPALRAKPCFKDIPKLRAFAVFVSDPITKRVTKVVALSDSDIETHGEWEGEAVHDLPRRQLVVRPVQVPERLQSDDEPDATEARLRLEIQDTSIGGPAPTYSRSRPGDEYLMALEGVCVFFAPSADNR